MRREELVQKLRASPFRPFRLYVSDGGAFDIRHPEMLMVMRHSAVVGMLERAGDGSQDDYPAIERSRQVDLLHITRIEELPQSERQAS